MTGLLILMLYFAFFHFQNENYGSTLSAALYNGDHLPPDLGKLDYKIQEDRLHLHPDPDRETFVLPLVSNIKLNCC